MSRAVSAGILVCVLALTGCSALAGLAQLQSDLSSAGYNATGINHNTTTSGSTLAVEVAMADAVPTDEDADRIAEVVWTSYPARFDELVIVINGKSFMDASADDLRDRFGERPASLGASSGGGGTNVVAIVVILAVAVLFAGLIVLLWRRGRRVPPPVAPPPYQSYQAPPSQNP